MEQPSSDTVQIAQKDLDELMELLGGYKEMLLSHEKRIGIIEQVLVDAATPPPQKVPQDHKRSQK